ncbi:THUMP-like domain-containing protein [Actinomycetospora sp. TBRC 11914]|uniref:class I SAM-dependent methyltransferase n=1 Tax=Actinomycetospora sp. TBRC 11914 TaxID=2729387 RepID=UPI00145FC845|nr:class I SAM-dependent methyltransferase [Actinomycetospora sp. TBRC 11914]NMO91236.1 class I SAM-dependent methyltransferase [Actinomycetospora sp. TBRC 11914]
MAFSFTVPDVGFLTSGAGVAALTAFAPSGDRLRDVAAARRLAGEEHAGALLETALLRARAAGRFPDGWLWTADALEQATALPVAEHRAARLAAVAADRVVADVTCSVGVETAVLSAALDRVVGADLDPVRLAMARANVPGARLIRADALAPPLPPGAVLVADPARRTPSGRRVRRPEEMTPPLDVLARRRECGFPDTERLRCDTADTDLVVSTAPGLDPALVPWAREVELVSLDGRVREAALWSAGLLDPDGPRRRATVLRTDGAGYGLTDLDDDTCPTREVGEWLVDPDGAVVRAGLVRQFAARHGLGQLDPHLAYLTGDHPPDVGRAFRVLEHGPYGEKQLRRALRRRGVGRVEILVRGLDVDPDRLRPSLKLAGPRAATVVLARVGRGARAYVCEPA